MNIPPKTFKITLQGNSYETRITQGKIIDFELGKITLSKGFYDSIRDIQTLNMIDVTAALLAFFPDIKKDSKLSNLNSLEPTEYKEVLEVMIPFFKWYNEWKEYMNTPDKAEEKKEDE